MSDEYDRLNALFEPTSVYAFNGDYGITLRPSLPETYVSGRTTGYRLYVQAVDPKGLEKEIFVYQRKPVLYQNEIYKDDFSGVASPADMEEYQIGEPEEASKPFFRLDYVDLVFRNVDLLIEALQGLASDTAELIRAKRSFDAQTTLGDITIGNPESSSSSSE